MFWWMHDWWVTIFYQCPHINVHMLGYDHWAAAVSFAVMPPLLLPLYFNFEIPYYMISRKQWAVSNGFIDPTPPTFPTQQ